VLAQHHPQLAPLADRVLQPTTAETLSGHDVVFLALPHGASAALARQLADDVTVIDCGADFRLRDAAAWQQFYGSDHAGSWAYGLPELVVDGGDKQRAQLTGATHIAVPGCYPTASSLALAPAFASGLATDDAVIVAASGTSGAGKSLKPHLLAAEAMGSMSPYGVGGTHRHTPEIEQNLSGASGRPVTVSFTPTLAPMPRGILATCSAKVAPGTTTTQVRAAYAEAYDAETFVQLLPEGAWPTTAAVLGSNNVQIQLAVDERVGRLIVVAAIDNLTKGTGGGAVQCLNLARGFDETLGLPTTGVAP
jgi:N-acetyl-gamma-glutamyl-phosphate reductase